MSELINYFIRAVGFSRRADEREREDSEPRAGAARGESTQKGKKRIAERTQVWFCSHSLLLIGWVLLYACVRARRAAYHLTESRSFEAD
jgi:hypothetical protein